MESFEARALINALEPMVWEVITDSGNFTVWDSGISQIDGELRHGGTIRVRARTGGSHRLRLRVRQVPGREMTWTGGLPLGLITGRRTFTLTPHAGATLLHIREEYTGPLVGLLGVSVPKIERDIAGYVSAVKKRAELLDTRPGSSLRQTGPGSGRG